MCVAISFSEINDLEEKIQKDLEIFEFRLFTNDILFCIILDIYNLCS